MGNCSLADVGKESIPLNKDRTEDIRWSTKVQPRKARAQSTSSRRGKQESWGWQGYLIKDVPVGAAATSTAGSALKGNANPIPFNSIGRLQICCKASRLEITL